MAAVLAALTTLPRRGWLRGADHRFGG